MRHLSGFKPQNALFTPRTRSYRILASLLLICLIFSLCACGDVRDRDILSYQSRDFRAQIRGETSAAEGTAFEAEVIHTADALTMTFTDPGALSGIVLQSTPDTMTISLGDIVVNADGWQDVTWFSIIKLFDLQGTPTAISGKSDTGTRVVWETEDGKSVILTLDADSGLPRRIVCGELWVEIASFEYLNTD